MENLTNLIDPTTFGTVRRCLNSARSPITTLMLVQHRDVLPRVALALVAEDGNRAELHRRQWTQWFGSGEVRLGGHHSGDSFAVDIDHIPDQAVCDVLYLPPVYLVCLRGYKPPLARNLLG